MFLIQKNQENDDTFSISTDLQQVQIYFISYRTCIAFWEIFSKLKSKNKNNRQDIFLHFDYIVTLTQ